HKKVLLAAVAGAVFIVVAGLVGHALSGRKNKDANDLTQPSTQRPETQAPAKDPDEVINAEQKLHTQPDDPQSNFVFGRHLALMRGDWDRALPMLAKGNEPSWKKAAQLDLVRPKNGAESAARGDAWWNLAKGETGFARTGLLWRACSWYERAY